MIRVLKKISVVAFAIIVMAGCGGGGGTTTTPTTTTDTSTTASTEGKLTGSVAAISASMAATSTGSGATNISKPSFMQGNRLMAAFNTSTNMLTFNGDMVGGMMDGTLTGSYNFSASNMMDAGTVTSVTYAATGGSLVHDMGSFSRNITIDGTSYAVALTGSMNQSMSGSFAVGMSMGSPSTITYNMVLSCTPGSDLMATGDGFTSTFTSMDFTVTLSGSGALSTTSPTIACSGTISYSTTMTDGSMETGQCTLASDCSACS